MSSFLSNPWILVGRALCTLVGVAGILVSAHARDAFGEYVWHRVRLGMNVRHVDVTVELTFFEEWSARERQRMDADQDGRIQRSELEEYAGKLEAELKGKVALLVGERRVELVPLYAPEVDLLGCDTVERSHHQITLRFFAPIPKELTVGAKLVVEDRLWPEARCLAESAAVVDAGGLLESGQVTERAFPAGADEPLRFTARRVMPLAAPLRTP